MKTKQPAVTPSEIKTTAPLNLRKRIGSTTYIVSVHFSDKSKETLEDKIIRLIESEVTKPA